MPPSWLAIVRRQGRALATLPAAAQADPAVVLAAIRQAPAALVYASADLRADPAFAQRAVTTNWQVFPDLLPPANTDPAVIMAALQASGAVVAYLPPDVQAAIRASDPTLQNAAVAYQQHLTQTTLANLPLDHPIAPRGAKISGLL